MTCRQPRSHACRVHRGIIVGISGDSIERDDVRAHGKDERLGVESFYGGVDFYYRFLKAVTSQN